MDRGTILRVWLPLLAGLLALGFAFQSASGPHGPRRLIGLVLALMGLAGVIVSRYTLGRSFSITPKATALVTSGIYSRIRNPIYVSAMFFLAGIVLMIRRLELLALSVVLIPVQIIRARREAGVLEAKFGDAYREYRKALVVLMHLLSTVNPSRCDDRQLPSCARGLDSRGRLSLRKPGRASAPVHTRA